MKLYKCIVNGLLIVSGAFTIGSCSSELDIDPTSELENKFFDSEGRVQQGIAACYASLSSMYGYMSGEGGGTKELLLLPGDDIGPNDDGHGALNAFSGLNASNGNVRSTWVHLYQMIYRTNFMLEKIEEPSIQAVVRKDGLLNANKGELLFLRAWAFTRLWDLFRKAPIQDRRIISIDDAELPPSKDFEMLDKAIIDLESAATLLPDASYWNNAADKGHVFNESAYGMLVKCYTLRARYNNKNADDYGKAIIAFEKIKTRELVNFEDNFDYHFENNAESLFEFQASYAPGQENPFLENDFAGSISSLGAFYHYFTGHWSNWTTNVWGPTKKLREAYEEGDPRKESTFSKTCTNVNGDVSVPQAWGWDFFNGYQFQKYVRPGKCHFEPTWQVSSSNNLRLLRFADVKLLAAEAYLQTGKPFLALAQINDIRARARRSTPDGSASLVPADLQTATMESIMHERFIELAGEDGIRWQDLRSWHAAGFINLSNWKSTDFGYDYDAKNFEFEIPKHLLFPIPQDELNTNRLMASEGNNPGYK